MSGLLVLDKLGHCSGSGEANGAGGRKLGRCELKRKGKELERRGGKRESNPREGKRNGRREEERRK